MISAGRPEGMYMIVCKVGIPQREKSRFSALHGPADNRTGHVIEIE